MRALMLGPSYNKSFDDKIRALEEALKALQDRTSALRDGAIVRSEKKIERVATIVSEVEKTGNVVDSTTKETLEHVHSLKSEVKGLNDSAKSTDAKMDEAHVKMNNLSDLEQARREAKEAMMIVLRETNKTSECKFREGESQRFDVTLTDFRDERER